MTTQQGKGTKLKKSLIVGTLNVRGINNDEDKDTIIKDKMDIVALTETHITDEQI